jgi:aldose 1-epimerase
MGDTRTVERTELEGFDAVVLRAGDLETTWVTGAGMLGWSLRHRGEELLARPRTVAEHVERGATTAIPLLHPWANRLDGDAYTQEGRTVTLSDGVPGVRRDEHGLPIHGLLGGAPDWRVVEADGERVAATLAWGPGRPGFEGFPWPHDLRYEVALTPEALEVAVTLIPSGEDRVPVSFGHHPYLRLPGVPRPEWLLELPEREALELDERSIPTGGAEHRPAERAPIGDRVLDDHMAFEPGAVLALEAGGRRLALECGAGVRYGQVWVPEGHDFACLEPMTAPVAALSTPGGCPLAERDAPFRAAWALRVTAN